MAGKRYTLEASEQETIIRWDETGDPVRVYTASPKVKHTLLRKGFVPVREEGESTWFELPKTETLIEVYCGKNSVKLPATQ